MSQPFIADIEDARHIEAFGKKGAGLHWLAKHRLPIPRTFVLTYAGGEHLNKNGSFNNEIVQEFTGCIDSKKLYAVRSSANLEDSKDVSFAGQFTTQTNVPGDLPSLQTSIQAVLASTHSSTLTPSAKDRRTRKRPQNGGVDSRDGQPGAGWRGI